MSYEVTRKGRARGHALWRGAGPGLGRRDLGGDPDPPRGPAPPAPWAPRPAKRSGPPGSWRPACSAAAAWFTLSVNGATGQHLHLHARVPGRFLPPEDEILAVHLDRSQAFVFPTGRASTAGRGGIASK